MKSTISILLLLLALHHSSCKVIETKLLRHLLDGTVPHVRPVYNPDHPVIVTFGFTLVQIVNLNEAEQSIVMKIWLRLIFLFIHFLTCVTQNLSG